MSLFAEMNAVYAKYFEGDFPARSAVAVKALPKAQLPEGVLLGSLKELSEQYPGTFDRYLCRSNPGTGTLQKTSYGSSRKGNGL